METTTEYENKLFAISNSLDIYKTFYLKQHLHEPLQAHDMDDLKQDLYILMMKLQKDNRCLQADDIENYCYRCYKNLVIKFAKQNSITAKRMQYSYGSEKELYEFLVADNPDSRVSIKNDKWKWASLKVLSDTEKKVVDLRSTGYSHKEIKRMIDYNGTVSGLRNIYDRARKKVIAEYKLLGKKRRLLKKLKKISRFCGTFPN